MITEDYCSYEVAKLLKENGFPINEHLYMYVNKDDKLMTDHQACLTLTNEEYRTFFDDYIPTITHQMAMKWLRRRHIIIVIVPAYFNGEQCASWDIDIWVDGNYKHPFEDYPTYEQAVDTALKFCLTEIL